MSTHASAQCNLSATRVIPLKFYSSCVWSQPVLTTFLPSLVHVFSSLSAFSSQPTSTLFCKRPFTDISSLLYNFHSLSLSLADANLSYLSTGTREIVGFSLFLSKPVLQIFLGRPSWKRGDGKNNHGELHSAIKAAGNSCGPWTTKSLEHSPF